MNDMSKISPGEELAVDASQQPAQQLAQAARQQKATGQGAGDPAGGAGAAGASHMKFAAQKIVHTPETPADYAMRVKRDKELRGLHMPDED